MKTSIDFSRFLGSRIDARDIAETKGNRPHTPGSGTWRMPGRRITNRDRSEFCTQLSVMLRSNISLQRALDVLEVQMSNPRMKSVVAGLRKEIQKGNTLARALSMHGQVFDALFVVSVEVGQESGQLDEVFEHLAIHLENINNLRRKFLQAMTYPILVLSVAFLVVFFFLFYIVPTFAEMFKSFQSDLPVTTRIIISASLFFREYGVYLVTAMLAPGLLAWKVFNNSNNKEKIDNYFSSIPLLDEIILKNHIARFCRTLGTLLHADVVLVEALEISKRMMTHRGMKKEIDQIITQVRRGNAIAQPMITSKIFPPMVGQMIAVGEETSELDNMLLKVAGLFEQEIQAKVDTLSSIAEPVLILMLGVIVALILISLYLPIFDVVNTIG